MTTGPLSRKHAPTSSAARPHTSTGPGRRWHPERIPRSHDILDFALLWHLLGGPSADTVRAAFDIEMDDYHRRLTDAVRTHRRRAAQPGEPAPELVYAPSVLDALHCAANPPTRP